MSSWSLDMRPVTHNVLRNAVLVALTTAAVSAAPAFGAQVFMQPSASVQAQTSSNIDLSTDSSDHKQTQGYSVDAATVIGIATPRSETTITPRVSYQYYPDQSDLDRLEAFLNFSTNYTSPRSTFRMYGIYDHRDERNAEQPAATFNEIVPAGTNTAANGTTTPETGRLRLGATRDDVLLVPTYGYKLTPRLGIGVSGTIESVRYSPDDDFSHIDFNYYQAKTYLGFDLNQRTGLSLGVYASKYDARNIDSRATSYGASVDVDFNWSPVWQSALSGIYQRTKIDQNEPTVFKDDVNAWGAEFSTTYIAQVSQVRFEIGRSITPSGGGGLYKSDQARLEYRRDLSERWQATGAVRYIRDGALSGVVNDNDRQYSRAELSLRWSITPTWFLQGGYGYTRQKYKIETGSADDNTVWLRFGYQGLQRQQR